MKTASFAFLQQDITTLQLQITTLTIINEIQSKKIWALTTTIQHLSTRLQVQRPTPASNSGTDQQTLWQIFALTCTTYGYLQQAITLLQGTTALAQTTTAHIPTS